MFSAKERRDFQRTQPPCSLRTDGSALEVLNKYISLALHSIHVKYLITICFILSISWQCMVHASVTLMAVSRALVLEVLLPVANKFYTSSKRYSCIYQYSSNTHIAKTSVGRREVMFVKQSVSLH